MRKVIRRCRVRRRRLNWERRRRKRQIEILERARVMKTCGVRRD